MMGRHIVAGTLFLLIPAGLGSLGAGGKKDPAPQATKKDMVILDSLGKEVPLKDWKFIIGTRRIPDGPKSIECLEFREDNSTTYQNGILTLVPLTSVRKLEYDYAKKKVTLTCLGSEGKDLVLSGPTKYVGINRVLVEGEADLGKLGSGMVKYAGGDGKNTKSIQGIRFPVGVPLPIGKGRLATVAARDKAKTSHKAAGLIPLYQVRQAETKSLPFLFFKKTVKIPMEEIVKLRALEPEGKKRAYDFEVTLKDGKQHNLTLLPTADPGTGKQATLAGLLGRVTQGYKLFPLHAVWAVDFEK